MTVWIIQSQPKKFLGMWSLKTDYEKSARVPRDFEKLSNFDLLAVLGDFGHDFTDSWAPSNFFQFLFLLADFV